MALSREGLEQAAILADLLGTEPVTAVYSSPRERAWYTARDIAEPHGLKVRSSEALDEVDFGEWTGMTFDALDADPAWAEWNQRRSTARPPGGESMAEAADRAASALDALAVEHEGEMIVAVSHCDIIRAVVARKLGLSLDHLLRFDVDPGSVSRISIGAWGAQIHSINERLYR